MSAGEAEVGPPNEGKRETTGSVRRCSREWRTHGIAKIYSFLEENIIFTRPVEDEPAVEREDDHTSSGSDRTLKQNSKIQVFPHAINAEGSKKGRKCHVQCCRAHKSGGNSWTGQLRNCSGAAPAGLATAPATPNCTFQLSKGRDSGRKPA